MKKILRALAKAVSFLLAAIVLLVAAVGVWHAVALRPFYASAIAEFPMPGADDRAFDQQALDYDEESGLFFFSGYMRDGTADPVYLVDAKSGNPVKRIALLNEDGTPCTTHAGGIAVTDRFIYLAGSSADCMYVFDKQEILAAEDGETVRCIGTFSTKTGPEDGARVSWIARDNEAVYVGEFTMPWIKGYALRANHTLQTKAGETKALMLGFKIDPEAPLGLSETPFVAIALPDYVQGACFDGESLYLSTSFAFKLSEVVKNSLVPEERTFAVMGNEVPLYSLRREAVFRLPPFGEEIVLYNGRIYASSEAVNMLFKGFGKLWGSEHCWSIVPPVA
ncbi:MAG: hypothetical protein Q4C53_01490 [Clostridia bacterium]|nr:hypothetical protein [Clostridia bacterium]